MEDDGHEHDGAARGSNMVGSSSDACAACDLEEFEKDLDQIQEEWRDYASSDREITEKLMTKMESTAQAEGQLRAAQSAALKPDSTTNTGPKGVLNDYVDAKQKLLQKMERDRQRTLAHIAAHSFTVQTAADEEAAASQHEDDIDRQILLAEEAFLREYDDHWSRELQRRQAASSETPAISSTQTSANRRMFGQMTSLSRASFVEFIDDASATTLVLIHLYQPSNKACIRLRQVLHDMAKVYPTIKFGEMLSTHAELSFDDLALPALLAYKSGSLLESFIKLTEDIGFNFDFDDVEEFLAECVWNSHTYLVK